MKQSLSYVLLLAFLAPPLVAQDIHLNVEGTVRGIRFGEDVAVLGDLTSDGVPEIVVGTIFGFPPQYAGSVDVLDGSNGQVLFSHLGDGSSRLFGTTVSSAGDWNGDGIEDYAAGAPGFDNPPGSNDRGYVKIFSGANGQELQTFQGGKEEDRFGAVIRLLGDVDGDNRDEILIGGPNAKVGPIRPGRAYVVSPTRGLLHTLTGPFHQSRFGAALDGVGDLNGDGVRDILVGAVRDGSSGSVFLFSGANGRLLKFRNGPAGAEFGKAVAGLDDVDNDGVADVLITSPGVNIGQGLAQVFSGKDGSVIYSIPGQRGEAYGEKVVAGGDIDGDGTNDFAVMGSGEGRFPPPGSVRVFSGATGKLIYTLSGGTDEERFAAGLALGGDFDNDGRGDVVIGISERNAPGLLDAGAVNVYTGTPAMQLGPAVPGTAGLQNTIDVTGAVPGATLLAYYSLSRGADSLIGCRDLSYNLLRPQLLGQVVADNSGRARFDVLIPASLSNMTPLIQAVAPSQCRVSHSMTQFFP